MGEFDFTYVLPKNFSRRVVQYLEQLESPNVAKAFQNCTYDYEDLGLAYYVGMKGDNWDKKALDFTVEGSPRDIALLKSKEHTLKESISKSLKSSESGFLLKEIYYFESESVEHIPLSNAARLNADIESSQAVLQDLIQMGQRFCSNCAFNSSSSENSMNDYFRDLLFIKGYTEVKDQTRHGLYVANEPKVSFRNGQFIVTDGQHTIEGRILRNGGKDLPILCKVYTGMTVEQEALLFAEQNGFSAPLTAGIKLRAKVVGGDAISKAFLAATNRVGLSLNYDSQQLTDYRIGCVGTAFRLYKQMGEPLYCETMRLIVAAWEGKPDSFRASVLKGMMHFVELYHGEFSEERLLRALRSIHPVDIYRIGQDDPAKLRGWKKYVFPVYTAYNGKCRKDALPMKF